MSVRATEWCEKLRGIPPTYKAVLFRLCWYHNLKNDGLCCPSVKRLAEETEFSISHINKAIQYCEAHDLLSSYWHDPMPGWERGFRAYDLAIDDVTPDANSAATDANSAPNRDSDMQKSESLSKREGRSPCDDRPDPLSRLPAEPTEEMVGHARKKRCEGAALAMQWERFSNWIDEQPRTRAGWMSKWRFWMSLYDPAIDERRSRQAAQARKKAAGDHRAKPGRIPPPKQDAPQARLPEAEDVSRPMPGQAPLLPPGTDPIIGEIIDLMDQGISESKIKGRLGCGDVEVRQASKLRRQGYRSH